MCVNDSAWLLVDDFARQSTKPTVIVMDKASIHTSQMIQERLEEWKNQQVEIFQLPPYSPQLSTGQKLNGVKEGIRIEMKVKDEVTKEIKTKTKNTFR